MRILHTADWHIGKKLDFFSRLDEQKAVLKEIEQIAHEEQVDMVLIAGDLFDTFSPSNEAMELLFRTLKNLAKNATRPVIAIAGNHDSPDRINAADVLARENGIIFIGNPKDIVPLFGNDFFRIEKSEEGFIEMSIKGVDVPVRLLHTAFANEQRLKEYFGEDKQKSLQDSLKERWNYLANKYCNQQGINLLMAHLFMQKRGGAILEEPDGEKPISVGTADLIYSDAIPEEIQYAALGHLHGFINVGSKQPVVYSSSPIAYSFSEANHKKGVVIIDIQNDINIDLKFIPLTSGKKLERKKFTSVTDAVEWLEANQDSLVELTIETNDFMSTDELKLIRQAHNGIIHLIPAVKKDSNIDADLKEIDLNQDIGSLFKDYFKSKMNGLEPNKEIMDLFNEIKNL